ncbi:MAG: NADH-quinone oxidoreductase subunit L [Bacteroidetes bacterium]|nr:NADH-quinone oxidoreductase subunit L [Bacteroidota bacterium]MCL5026038.1 NADH-quinone oxidoreductase subunit L [Chloroflexota bacterium]
MLQLLWLVPALPFAGFVLLALSGRRLPDRWVPFIGVGSVGLSLLAAVLVATSFLAAPPPGYAYSQTLWTWMSVGSFTPGITLYLDALSLVMVVVVTFVGFFIHLYSAEFMAGGEGYGRFFAYMNLFVGSMLTLVLASNLLLLYLGWEGVGLCSYLLIGFWYQDSYNGYAARKAFVVTRVGDAALAIGLFLIFNSLGTLEIQDLMRRAAQQWAPGSALALSAAALLLVGALGKSAQLPLQTWLPDAMAGPTPVSALIHAATMVTAGVYLIARTNVLFALAPAVQLAVAVIGAVTLLLAGFSALTQWDIKRVLAYSTISQIGYMFLALGVGAWTAAIFHFMTHAFFKSLLFLAAGVVIMSLDEEHDMFKMGGLRRSLPLAFWTFLVGAASLSALPLVTAGGYSKESILYQAWAGQAGSPWLWAVGIAGAFLTGMYSFRMVFLTFFGEMKQQPSKKPSIDIGIPLVVLAALSIAGGYIDLPRTLGNLPILSSFLQNTLPPTVIAQPAIDTELVLGVIAGVVPLIGIYFAYLLFFQRRPAYADGPTRVARGGPLYRLWFAGWGFDWLYDRLIVRPFVWAARADKDDVIDSVYDGITRLNVVFNNLLSGTESGRVRWYAAGIALGAVVVIAIGVFA